MCGVVLLNFNDLKSTHDYKIDYLYRPDDEIFYCEATKEVFRDYEEFFQRTILCNSLVWSCSITGKAGLTYEEAVDCEKKARSEAEGLCYAVVMNPGLYLYMLLP